MMRDANSVPLRFDKRSVQMRSVFIQCHHSSNKKREPKFVKLKLASFHCRSELIENGGSERVLTFSCSLLNKDGAREQS